MPSKAIERARRVSYSFHCRDTWARELVSFLVEMNRTRYELKYPVGWFYPPYSSATRRHLLDRGYIEELVGDQSVSPTGRRRYRLTDEGVAMATIFSKSDDHTEHIHPDVRKWLQHPLAFEAALAV